jgi:hypothetical protein
VSILPGRVHDLRGYSVLKPIQRVADRFFLIFQRKFVDAFNVVCDAIGDGLAEHGLRLLYALGLDWRPRR